MRENIKRTHEKIKERNQKIQEKIKQRSKTTQVTIKISTSKTFFIIFFLLIQLAILVTIYVFLQSIVNTTIFLIASEVIAILFSVYILNSDAAIEYRLAWIMVVLILNLVGIMFYLILGLKKMSKKEIKKRIRTIDYCPQDPEILEKAELTDMFFTQTAKMINEDCKLPLDIIDDCEYFEIGEKYFTRLKEELLKAEKFIFLEFFIFTEGSMWKEIYEIIKRKAESGVEVRIIYDDFGCLNNPPKEFGDKGLHKNIKMYRFNPIRPILDVAQNNRTHRKIIVIDGMCAFTGGLNIADEYINREIKYGHWKDTGIMIKGNAVSNFTIMFLAVWMNRFGKEDIEKYLKPKTALNKNSTFCIPFCDAPEIRKTICENVYLKIIYNAKKYIYINTPYLIIDSKISEALLIAIRSGVDVRITVPHIPDKKIVFALTQAFYTPLVLAGAKIYEYEPGFIHAKSIVSDDKYCVIGTSNMDYRSFYLHYECNIFMYEGICEQMRKDYELTCEKAILRIPENLKRISLIRRISRSLLRLFAPLL